MDRIMFVLEMVGTIAFAISGALVALHKEMDVFGVCTLGLVTACGGGVARDLFLGLLPPVMFQEPVYALTAICCSILVFLPFVRRFAMHREQRAEILLLVTDSVGLGAFTAAGVSAVMNAGFGGNRFFAVFLGMITGVGGGVLRDVFAGQTPAIFVKHVYAFASLIGAVLCVLCYQILGETWATVLCLAVVTAIRLLAAHFHWNLPRVKEVE